MSDYITLSKLLRALAAGRLQGGNIDLYRQPEVRNPDGGVSTVYSMGVNFGGKEYLLPRVTPDGRFLSDEEAINEFRRTGKHLGVYAEPQSAARAAQALHDQYEAGNYTTKLNQWLNAFGTNKLRP